MSLDVADFPNKHSDKFCQLSKEMTLLLYHTIISFIDTNPSTALVRVLWLKDLWDNSENKIPFFLTKPRIETGGQHTTMYNCTSGDIFTSILCASVKNPWETHQQQWSIKVDH